MEGRFTQSFDDERVVEGAQKGIFNENILGVAKVDSVRVIAPESDETRAADRQAVASREGRAPRVGIAKEDSVDCDIPARVEEEETVELAPFEGRRVENTGPGDRHVLNVLPVNPPVDDGSRVDKDFVAAFDVDASDVMDAGSEVSEIRGVEILWFFVDRGGEEV